MSERPSAVDRPERVLVIGAHPDDAEFYAGATLARMRAQGAEVTLVICTDGAMGGPSEASELCVRRRDEAARAVVQLGGIDLVQLDFPDGGLTVNDVLRERLVAEIRRTRPVLLLTHDPATLWLRVGAFDRFGHSDHRATGLAALDAVYPRAGLARFFPAQIAAGLAPWFVRETWLFDTAAPDHFVPMGEYESTKHAALRAHASQMPDNLVRECEEEAALWATHCGARAEAFRRARLW
jgi:LmbE family N-acetylglucosaminyl deacetylase